MEWLKRHHLLWLPCLVISALVFTFGTIFYNGVLASPMAELSHDPEGDAAGFWTPIVDEYPHDERLQCAVWVNRGDHDTSLVWCVEGKEKDKDDD